MPFDPNMKKKKKKKKTGFDPDALEGCETSNDTAVKVEEQPAESTETNEQSQEKSVEEGKALYTQGSPLAICY